MSDDAQDYSEPEALTDADVDADAVDTPEEGPSTEELAIGFLTDTLRLMGFADATVTWEPEDEENLVINIEGEGLNDVLMASNGRPTSDVIEALTQLVRKAAFTSSHESRNVLLDVGSYRKNRVAKLASVSAQRARAVQSGHSVEVFGMSSFDRRAVHRHLAEQGTMQTSSRGYGSFRRLIVNPES